MEAILVLTDILGGRTRVLIFKKSERQWWRIGEFFAFHVWRTEDVERMLELHEIVGFGFKDIVIRLTGGGTDIEMGLDLSIYRIYRGRLYRTFSVSEEFAVRRYPSPDVTMIDDERHRIYYPRPDQSGEAYIVVRTSKQLIPASEWGVIESSPTIVDCVPYRWDPVKYLFEPDVLATPRFCRPARRQ